MDAVEYELLSRLADGGAVFRPGDPRLPGGGGFHYTVGRLLQLRARGLIRFADEWADDYNAIGPCLLTTAGRRALQQYRGTSPIGTGVNSKGNAVTLESLPRQIVAEEKSAGKTLASLGGGGINEAAVAAGGEAEEAG
jgi:hypothetical protein